MNTDTNWPSWVSAIITAIGGAVLILLASLRGMFVTRAEFYRAIQDFKEDIGARHEESRNERAEVLRRVTAIDNKTARIEGQLSGRYPRIDVR